MSLFSRSGTTTTSVTPHDIAKERLRLCELVVAGMKLIQAGEDAEAARMLRIAADGLDALAPTPDVHQGESEAK